MFQTIGILLILATATGDITTYQLPENFKSQSECMREVATLVERMSAYEHSDYVLSGYCFTVKPPTGI